MRWLLLALILVITTGYCDPTDKVIKERISKDYDFSPAEIDEVRKDCEKNQYAMNVCSLYDSVRAKIIYEESLNEVLSNSAPECGITIRAKLPRWNNEVATTCLKQADKEVGYTGSMRALVANSCRESAYAKEAARLISLKQCQPCQECLRFKQPTKPGSGRRP